jgi:hypothetical protein
MPVITSSQLDFLCSFLVNATYPYYPVTQSFAADLYNTGCRPNELLFPTRWSYISDEEIILQPLKNNLPRYFKKVDLSISLFNGVINQVSPYNNLSLRQLQYNFYNVLPVNFVGTVDKSAIAYIFRYNYVRKLHDEGLTDNDILYLMGWQYPWLPYIYYSKILISDIPFTTIKKILDFNGDSLIDSDGTFVIDIR